MQLLLRTHSYEYLKCLRGTTFGAHISSNILFMFVIVLIGQKAKFAKISESLINESLM